MSKYLQYLPAVYQDNDFLVRFLRVFEKILSGIDDEVSASQGIEQVLDTTHIHFDAYTTPSEFLHWLAGWVGLVFRGDWGIDDKRAILDEIVHVYPQRGTKQGLQQILRICGISVIDIIEWFELFQLGVRSRIGAETFIEGGPPYCFTLRAELPYYGSELERKTQILRSIIDLEKPAHTHYHLFFIVPSMQISVHSTIGRDTLLGATH